MFCIKNRFRLCFAFFFDSVAVCFVSGMVFVCYFAFFGSVMVCFAVRTVLVCYFALFLTLLGLFGG